MNVLKAGLTGGLATGKSFVAAELERLGAVVIRADKLGHQVLLQGGAAYAGVVERFGREILDGSGEIDRSKLAKIVFPDPAALEALNAIVHPVVFALEERIFETLPQGTLAVVEAAILIETGSYKRLDKLIVAHCTHAQQVERAMQRPGARREDVMARLARQMPPAQALAVADFSIDTSGTEAETLRQTQEVFATLKRDL